MQLQHSQHMGAFQHARFLVRIYDWAMIGQFEKFESFLELRDKVWETATTADIYWQLDPEFSAQKWGQSSVSDFADQKFYGQSEIRKDMNVKL